MTIETLYPLIRTFNIDPTDLFYPEHSDNVNCAVAKSRTKLATFTEAEAILLDEICEAALRTLRSPNTHLIYKQSLHPFPFGKSAGSAFYAWPFAAIPLCRIQLQWIFVKRFLWVRYTARKIQARLLIHLNIIHQKFCWETFCHLPFCLLIKGSSDSQINEQVKGPIKGC